MSVCQINTRSIAKTNILWSENWRILIFFFWKMQSFLLSMSNKMSDLKGNAYLEKSVFENLIFLFVKYTKWNNSVWFVTFVYESCKNLRLELLIEITSYHLWYKCIFRSCECMLHSEGLDKLSTFYYADQFWMIFSNRCRLVSPCVCLPIYLVFLCSAKRPQFLRYFDGIWYADRFSPKDECCSKWFWS